MRQQVPIRSFKHAFKGIFGIAAVLLVFGIAGCGGSGSSAAPTPHDKLASLCERTTDGDSDYCGCVADQIITAGYDTEDEVTGLEALATQADQSGDFSQLPPAVLTALDSCKSSTS